MLGGSRHGADLAAALNGGYGVAMRLNMDYSVKWLVGSVITLVALAVIGAVVVVRETVKILMPVLMFVDSVGR